MPRRYDDLREAVITGDAAEVEKVLARGVGDVNAVDRDGFTALHAAIHPGHVEVVRVLLAHGADPNVRSGDGLAALNIALDLGSRAITDLLVGHGARLALVGADALDVSPSAAWLIAVDRDRLRAVPVKAPSVVVGRDPAQCSIAFQDFGISRVHARIDVAPDGALTLTDLKSKSGSWINGVAVLKAPLVVGDRVRLGMVQLAVVGALPAAPRDVERPRVGPREEAVPSSPTLEETLVWIDGLCARVADAHRTGAVHGDLHRGRIRLAPNGRIEVDFSPKAGALPGLSPEQLRGSSADARSDVFALGCVAYELLTGRRPFEGATLHALMYRVLHEDPPEARTWVPTLSAALGSWLQRALAKDPAARFANAGEMLEALRHAPRDAAPVDTRAPVSGEDVARLCEQGDDASMARLLERLKEPGGNDVALTVLHHAPNGAAAIPTLIEALSDTEVPPLVRGIVARVLGKHGPAAEPAILALSRAMSSRHHVLALDASYAILPIVGIAALGKAALSGVPIARARAIEALRTAGGEARPVVPTLLAVARDRQDPLRDAAWAALWRIGGDQAVAALVEASHSPLVATVPRPASSSSDDVESDIYVLNPTAEPFLLRTRARFSVTVDEVSGAAAEHGPAAGDTTLPAQSATKVGDILGWERDSALFFQISYRRVHERRWEHLGTDLKRSACVGHVPMVGARGVLHYGFPVNENGTRD